MKQDFLLETVKRGNDVCEVIDNDIISANSVHAAKLQIRRMPKYKEYKDSKWMPFPFSDSIFLVHSNGKTALVLRSPLE